jgi:predicted transcriptional regulator
MTRTSDVDKVRLRELWEEGESVADIAEELGITTSSVYKISIADNFPRREDGRKPKADPTIEEIYDAAAAIRATWSSERLSQSGSGRWMPPVV